LVPVIQANISEGLLFGIDGIVDDRHIGTACNGHADLPRINKYIVLSYDIRPALITDHDAAAAGAWTAAPYPVPADYYGIGSEAIALIYIYGILGIALANNVFYLIVHHPVAGAAYIVKLNKLAARVGALHIFTLATDNTNGLTLNSIYTSRNICNIATVDTNIGALIKLDAYSSIRPYVTMRDNDIVAIVQRYARRRYPANYDIVLAV